MELREIQRPVTFMRVVEMGNNEFYSRTRNSFNIKPNHSGGKIEYYYVARVKKKGVMKSIQENTHYSI